MRYTYEFKLKCIELYQQGRELPTPKHISIREFRKAVRKWVRIAESCGLEALNHSGKNRKWTSEEKFELVSKILAGDSIKNTALTAGIEPGLLHLWFQSYKIKGYQGLIPKPKGRIPKEPQMERQELPAELSILEKEELIRLKAENEYLRAENEAIKKSIALSHERWDAQLKAKKQTSSKNSEKRDSH